MLVVLDWVPGPFPTCGRRRKLGLPEREVILLPPPPRRCGGGFIATLLRALLLFAL